MKRSSIEFEFYSGNMFEIYLKDYLVTSKLYHPPSPPPTKKLKKTQVYWPVCLAVMNAFVSGAGGLRFKSQADQIGHNVATHSPPPQHFKKKLFARMQ